MNNKRGISLIVLVITIIVMIILASAIILALSGNGVILKTNKAKFQNDMATMKEELSVYISDREVETNGAYNHELLNANKNNLVEEGISVEGKTILDVIKSMDKKYLDKMEIANGKLRYTGSDTNEIKWSDEILEGISGYDLEEVNIEEANTLKLSDSANMSLSNYRIYGNGTSLPEEYQQVEYIEATGTQYIDTVLGFNKLYTYCVEVSYNSTNEQYAMGIAAISPYMYAGVDTTLFTTYGEKNINGNRPTYKTGDRVKYILKNGLQTINDVEVSTHTSTSNGKNVYLFALNNQSAESAYYYSNVKMYSYKVLEEENVIQEFIPCYRKVDEEIGMYDLVNDVFYTNQGTGEFLKGEDIDTVGDYVVDMNFDNKWIQGHVLGNESLVNNRLTSKNLIKSEIGAKYKVTSNLPDDIQLSLANGTYTTYPYNESDCLYDSGWLDDDLTFTSTINGNIVMAIRHKDNSNITPKDVEKYEIKVEKYPNEVEEGGQYVIPIKVSGKNLFDMSSAVSTGSTSELLEKGENYAVFKMKDSAQNVEPGASLHSSGWVNYKVNVKPNTMYSVSYDIEYLEKPDNVSLPIKHMLLYNVERRFSISELNKTYKVQETNTNSSSVINLTITCNSSKIKISNLQVEANGTATDYEPYIEPKTYDIYLKEPLRRVGDYVDYIDFRTQEVVRYVEVVDDTEGEQVLRGLDTPIREKIKLPKVMLNQQTNVFSVLTQSAPSKIETLYYTK